MQPFMLALMCDFVRAKNFQPLCRFLFGQAGGRGLQPFEDDGTFAGRRIAQQIGGWLALGIFFCRHILEVLDGVTFQDGEQGTQFTAAFGLAHGGVNVILQMGFNHLLAERLQRAARGDNLHQDI